MKKRVVFPKGNQKKLIAYLKQKMELDWKSLARLLNLNEKTLSKSYFYELCSLPENVFIKMGSILSDDDNKLIEKYRGKIVDEKIIIGRKCFGERRITTKHSNISYLKNNLSINISKINKSKYDLEKNIKLPDKMTKELAEEIGMHFGDGFLSESRYEYRLKGNINDEKEYYISYIKPLFKKLYNLNIKLKEFDGNTFGFELRSKAFWEFKTKALGIKAGKKYEIDVPNSVKIKSKEILAGFLRGLFDTDGSIDFKSKYGYKEYYPTISISLTSKKVIKEVAKMLEMFGLKPKTYYNEVYGRIFLYGVNRFKRFNELVGWSSPKNLNKIDKWEKRYPQLNNMVVVV